MEGNLLFGKVDWEGVGRVMPEISILVPVYNVETYLVKCMDSILGQSFSDFEVLCMDDGSTDTSGCILDQYAKEDGRVQVIHKRNTGYGHTMNQALQMAKGKYIGIVESDDYIAKDMYKELYQQMEELQLDIVKTDYYDLWSHEDGTEEIRYHTLTKNKEMYHRVIEPNQEMEAYFLEKFTWNALYRRNFLMQNQIQYNETPGASYQDNGFWFQTFYYAKRVMFLDQAFYRYKQDNPNSSIHSTQKVYAMKSEYDFIRKFLERNQEKEKKLYQICFHFRIKGYLYTLEQVADSLKLELAQTMAKECKQYQELGEIALEWMTEERQIIEQIKESPEQYVKKRLAEKEAIRKGIEGFSHVIIYGAGNYGKRAYHTIKKLNEIKVDMAVTNLYGKKEY